MLKRIHVGGRCDTCDTTEDVIHVGGQKSSNMYHI